MKAKIGSVAALFLCAIAIFCTGVLASGRKLSPEDKKSEQLVALNEIEQLALHGDLQKLEEKSGELAESIRGNGGTETHKQVLMISAISAAFVVLTFSYVYVSILRPFDKLKRFAGEIAQGNFNIPLRYERSNYFGEFTWAFDSMRREITKARACEKEAIDNNKTVIATLSHDIKTPIASIRAYSEGLSECLDGSFEMREKYLDVIRNKCDEVARLTDDLFLHSLSDLDKLKINAEKLEACGFLEKVIQEIATGSDIHFEPPGFEAEVMADKNRLVQIVENLINNARKYAKSPIDIFITCDGSSLCVHFRDYGGGIPDGDLPFIFDKFYRGKNCGDEPGSGLGLYIVKYIVQQMKGEVCLYNHNDGLEAVVSLPVISQSP